MLDEAKAWVDLVRDDLDTAVGGLAPQFFAGEPSADVLEWTVADMARCHPLGASRASWDFLNADYRDVMSDVTMPTLIVSGEHDVSVPAGNAPYLHENLPGSRLTVMAGAAHCPFLEQPREFNATVAEFVTEATAGR